MPSSFPHHRFAIHGQHAQLTISVTAALTAPWTVVFGPSGSGKSTVLRALAGLIPHFTVRFERTHPDTLLRALHSLPPERRSLAYAPQGAALFPNLTALDNIRFPETLRKLPATASRVPALTELLHLQPLLGKRPAQLSGGERQRVSLARALAVPDACLLLLDEPFAGLDRALRDELLPSLRQHLLTRNLPVLSVTHDPDEALLLKAEVLRLQSGHLTAQGPAQRVLADEIARLQRILGSGV